MRRSGCNISKINRACTNKTLKPFRCRISKGGGVLWENTSPERCLRVKYPPLGIYCGNRHCITIVDSYDNSLLIISSRSKYLKNYCGKTAQMQFTEVLSVNRYHSWWCISKICLDISEEI